MDKNSLKKEKKIFLGIGEHKKDKTEIIEKPVLFDKQQYSVKIPKEFIKRISGKKGDIIVFTLIKPFDINEKPSLKMEYKKK